MRIACAIVFYFLTLLLLPFGYIYGYNQAATVNLGLSSFFDGAVPPTGPGWYLQEYLQYYHSHRFLDDKGNRLGGVKSPNFNSWALVSHIVYFSNQEIVNKGKWGFEIVLPYALSLDVSRNKLDIRASSTGVGDFLFGPFIQWDPIMKDDKPIFVQRLAFDIILPSGKNHEPKITINPGCNFCSINPYWALTWFVREHISASWRLHYLWNAKNSNTHIQAGDAFHINFASEYEIIDKTFYLGLNGYFLQQVRNSKFKGHSIPNSKERVFAIGPGLLYQPQKETGIFLNIYFESFVRNRPKGGKGIFRVVQYF